MQIQIEIPEDIGQALKERWGDLPRHAVETLASEGYSKGALSESQVKRLLGFESRLQVHEFLKRAGIPLAYSEQDLRDDLHSLKPLCGE